MAHLNKSTYRPSSNDVMRSPCLWREYGKVQRRGSPCSMGWAPTFGDCAGPAGVGWWTCWRYDLPISATPAPWHPAPCMRAWLASTNKSLA